MIYFFIFVDTMFFHVSIQFFERFGDIRVNTDDEIVEILIVERIIVFKFGLFLIETV